MSESLHQIIEEESFEEDRASLYPDAKRLDEILEGVWILLCARPEMGTPIPDSDGLYVVVTAEYPDAPALGVTYRFDAEHTYLLGLELN